LLFVYCNNSIIHYFLVYVDDLVITESDNQFVSHVVITLGAHFSLKDMGSLHYFLGVEVSPTTAGLFLSQHKYVDDISESKNGWCKGCLSTHVYYSISSFVGWNNINGQYRV
jgi:hypothetical protein